MAEDQRDQDHEPTAVEVTRSVDLDAALDEVWAAVADPELRQAWLDDEDALGRELVTESVDARRSLSWTWWRPEDPASASMVEVVLTELVGGGTRVAVTERLVGQPGLVAQASAGAPRARAVSLWDSRLLGLELLFLPAGICVA